VKLYLPLGGYRFWSRQAYRLGYASQREGAKKRLRWFQTSFALSTRAGSRAGLNGAFGLTFSSSSDGRLSEAI
jgi:hypothetical protein